MRTRANALPESTHYPDNGCTFHPACLDCPEPICLFESGARRRRTLESRQAIVLRHHREGQKVREIAAAMGCSRRTAYRLLRTAADG